MPIFIISVPTLAKLREGGVLVCFEFPADPTSNVVKASVSCSSREALLKIDPAIRFLDWKQPIDYEHPSLPMPDEDVNDDSGEDMYYENYQQLE